MLNSDAFAVQLNLCLTHWSYLLKPKDRRTSMVEVFIINAEHIFVICESRSFGWAAAIGGQHTPKRSQVPPEDLTYV